MSTCGLFTLFFNGQCWEALIIEEMASGECEVGRYLFHKEPSMAELYQWIDKELPFLKFQKVTTSLEKEGLLKQALSKNHKKIQHEMRRAKENRGMGSYAHEMEQKSLEIYKKEKNIKSREEKKEFETYKYLKKKEKQLKKKRGK